MGYTQFDLALPGISVTERPTAPRECEVEIHCPKCGWRYDAPGYEQNGQKWEDDDRPDCPRCEDYPEPVWAQCKCEGGHTFELPGLDSGEHPVVVDQSANGSGYPLTEYPHCPTCGAAAEITTIKPRRDE